MTHMAPQPENLIARITSITQPAIMCNCSEVTVKVGQFILENH